MVEEKRPFLQIFMTEDPVTGEESPWKVQLVGRAEEFPDYDSAEAFAKRMELATGGVPAQERPKRGRPRKNQAA